MIPAATAGRRPARAARNEDSVGSAVWALGTGAVVLMTAAIWAAARLSDLTAYLAGGELIEYGPTEALFTNPRDPRTESYLTGRIA